MILLPKCNYPAFAKFGLVLTVLLITGCRPALTSPEHISGVEELKTTGEGSMFDPRWNAMGTMLVINNYQAPMGRIYLFNLENNEMILLYETNGNAIAKDWTPDGKLVTAFIDTAYYKEGIYNIDPGDRRLSALLTTGHEASWSPDGTKLAVLDYFPWTPSEENTESLRIIDIQSGSEDTVFKVKGKDILATGLSWSRNGKYIAFSLNLDHQGGQIYVLDVKTKTLTKITDGKDDSWSPSWAPNDELVSYVSRSSTNFQNSIIISTIDGKCKVPVPEITDVWSVAWSPTGRELLFGWRNTKIYLVDLDIVFKRNVLTEGINCS